jgi:ABC-type glycerol-3-phosphate transport system permease component
MAIAVTAARARRQRTHRTAVRWLQVAALTAVAVSTIYPLVFVASTALKRQRDYADDPIALPTHPTFDALRAAWTRSDVATFALHSLIVVTISVALIVVVSALAGYAFVHFRFPLRRPGLLGVLSLMMLPASVLMIPIFSTVQDLGLLNSYAGLVLVYVALQAPFSIYMMTSFFQRLPRELIEAAQVDGAGPLRAFRSIAVPLAKPAILTLVTLNFLWLWNELLFSLLILQDNTKRTLMVGLALLKGEYTTDIPLLSAGMLLALLPPLLVFAAFQRNLASGLTAGAVK